MLKQFKNLRVGLFEILILIFFILIVTSLYFFLFRTKKELTIVVKTFEDSIVWPGQRSVIWFNKIFYKGMKEKDALGRTSAEVINIRKYDDRQDNATIYLTLKLRTVYTPGTKLHTYKGKTVLVGSTLQFYLDNVFVEALIVDVMGVKNRFPLTKLLIQGQLTNPEEGGILPFLAENIPEGAEIKDTEGGVILKILRKEIQPALKLVTTDQGDILLSRDPLRKDVYLTLNVWAFKINNRYYFFDDIPILINEGIPIHLPHLSIYPLITSIKEVK